MSFVCCFAQGKMVFMFVLWEVPPFPILILKIILVTSANYIANNTIFLKNISSGKFATSSFLTLQTPSSIATLSYHF
jgi:hypothetical protein